MAASGAGFAAVLPSRHASLRALTSASEFLAGSRGGLAVVEDLADLSALSEWPPTIEAVVRLRHVARGTGSTVIFSTSRLTDAERRALRELRFTWWSLPDPAREIEAILAQSFGNGAVRLLASFSRSHGLRQEELTTDHVPALLDFLTRAITELSGVVAGTAGHGLRTQLEAAASGLRSFAAQGAEELARGKWPSRISSEAHPDLLVPPPSIGRARRWRSSSRLRNSSWRTKSEASLDAHRGTRRGPRRRDPGGERRPRLRRTRHDEDVAHLPYPA